MILNSAPKKATFSIVKITIENPIKPDGPFRVFLSVLNGSVEPRPFSLKRTKLEVKEDDPESYGKALGKALFSNRVLGVDYQKLLFAANVNQERMHICLDIKADALQKLHWERIYHPCDHDWLPLGSNAATPLSRMAPPGVITPVLRVHERPLRMLVIIASPNNLKDRFHLDPISYEECLALHRNMDALIPKGVNATYLESGSPFPPTLDNFRKFAPQNFHLIHFLCHGAITEGGTVLFLEGEDGKVEPVTTERLTDAMQILNPKPLFCFLAACESAERDAHDAFLPLGPVLVKNGCVQAVVAMDGKVGIETARVFSSQFYERLLVHGLVDLAVNEARSLVQEHWDWGVPVLISRIEDNQLFDFPQTNFYEYSVALNDQAYLSVLQAKDTALEHAQEVGMQAIDNIDDLIKELNKSHCFLNKIASDFRNLGYDKDTLAKNFPIYCAKFKRKFLGKTWVKEKTSCRKIKCYTEQIIKVIGPYLEDQNRKQLELELNLIGTSDDNMIGQFKDFLGQMNNTVDQIYKKLLQNKPEDALESKLAFDTQIDPTLRRSIDMFDKMEGSLERVQKAA